MDYFISFMFSIIDFMKTPINIWGFETSMWGILIFVMLGSIVFSFIGGLLNL